jgi:2'-5' RNA ligase
MPLSSQTVPPLQTTYTCACMRLFIGIPLATPVVHELERISLRYRASGDGLRWSTPESWHITLQFLGNTTQPQYELIADSLRKLHAISLPIQLEEMGFFDRAGIFFAGITLTPELLALQQRVTAATLPCGFVPEDHPYRPHITLARSKGRRKTPGFAKLKAMNLRPPKFSRFVANEFLLYESLTHPTGSQYQVRERFQLSI